jgi:glucose-1-phosphate adenylyltransferase
LRRCIIDKNVVIPPGFTIGHDHEADRERFTVSDGGVVAVAKNTVLD